MFDQHPDAGRSPPVAAAACAMRLDHQDQGDNAKKSFGPLLGIANPVQPSAWNSHQTKGLIGSVCHTPHGGLEHLSSFVFISHKPRGSRPPQREKRKGRKGGEKKCRVVGLGLYIDSFIACGRIWSRRRKPNPTLFFPFLPYCSITVSPAGWRPKSAWTPNANRPNPQGANDGRRG